MALGRKTGGRKKGTPNKATAAKATEIAATGETPLDYMIRVMRDPEVDPLRRDKMAAAAAAFVHPKLTATTLATDPEHPPIAEIRLVAGRSTEGVQLLSGDGSLKRFAD